jgi:hypothetical protein
MNKAAENMSEKSICPSIRSGIDPSCSHIEDPKHSGLQFRMFTYLLDGLFHFKLAGNVRSWHLADIPSCTAHVRFWG